MSFHHADQAWRDRFDALFKHLFINCSVRGGDISPDNSTEYIKRLIQDDYVRDASVVVVLVGPQTYCRKHVDWEISAGLNKKVGGYSGLLGLCLPSHIDYQRQNYTESAVPARLVDNLKSGYAKLYDWTEDASVISQRVQYAFESRISLADRIDNSRQQLQRNLC